MEQRGPARPREKKGLPADKALAQERTMLLPKGEEPAQRFKREADPWAWGTSWNVFYLGVAIAPTEVAFPDPSRLLLPLRHARVFAS